MTVGHVLLLALAVDFALCLIVAPFVMRAANDHWGLKRSDWDYGYWEATFFLFRWSLVVVPALVFMAFAVGAIIHPLIQLMTFPL
jgi:hypothetical protein